MIWMWLGLSALLFGGGEAFSKSWASEPASWKLLVVLTLYCAGALAWLPALRLRNHLASVGTLWAVLALAATVLIGVVGFGEPFERRHLAGFLMAAIAALYLA